MELVNKFLGIAAGLVPMKFVRYHYFRIQQFVDYICKKYDYEGKKILDIGAESQPYRSLFPEKSYYSQDIVQNATKNIDFVGDIVKGIPAIKTNDFDYILCTQVLEHIYDPRAAFEEFARVLKPGGRLFLTTHMVFDEHMEPYDYYRFTKYGLKSLGDEAGFSLEHIKPHGGVFTVLAYIISFLPIKIFSKRGSRLYYLYLIIFSLPILIMNIASYYLDFLDKEKSLTLNYECIYKKN
jgi:SAM-dependent methyltransferase